MMTAVSSARFAGLAAFAIAIAACNENEFRDPSVETMRLTAGTQVVEVSRDGTCTGCPLVIGNGTTLTAEWLTAAGTPDPIVNAQDFRLGVFIPVNSIGLGHTLSTSNNFVAIFTATGTSSTPLNLMFWLRRIQAGTDNFPPTLVPTVVQ